MKRLSVLTLITLLLAAALLVSCDDNANSTGKTMDAATAQSVGTSFSDLSSNIKAITDIDTQDPDYSKNVSITIEPGKGDSFSFLTANETDMTPATAGEIDPQQENNNEFQSVTFTFNYENTSVAGSTEYELTTIKESVAYILKDSTQTDPETVTATIGDDESWNSLSETPVMTQIKSLLDVYLEDQVFTLNEDSLAELVKFASSYEPEFTIESDFGKSENDRGKIKAVFTLTADSSDNLSINLISLDISIGDNKYFSVADSKLALTFSEDFSIKATVAYECEKGFDVTIDTDDEECIKGTVTVTFNNLKVTVNQINNDVYINGTASYNFTEEEVKFNISNASIYKNDEEVIGFGFTYGGNFKTARKEGTWNNILKSFTFTSFRVNGQAFDPSTAKLLLKMYKQAIINFLREEFDTSPETDSQDFVL